MSAACSMCILALSSWSVGGVERSVLELRLGLSGRLLLPWCPPETVGANAKSWFESLGEALLIHPRHRLDRRGLSRVVRLVSVLRCQPERVVNLHSSTVSGASYSDVLACRLAGKRVVLTLHSPMEDQTMGRRARRRVARAANAADAVVVTSQFACDFVREIVGGRPRIEVIPLGLRARPIADGSGLRARIGIPSGDFVISHVARSHRGKGLPDLASAIVHSGLRERVWVLGGGTGPDHAAVSAEARGLLGHRYVDQGWLNDPDATYAASDVFAMPSRVEAFGMVYLESALQSVPSVAYRTGGVPTVVEDGETGHLVALGDVPALGGRIAQLLHNREACRSMGEAARRRALTEFSLERMAASYEALFSDLIGSTRGADPVAAGLGER